ncbi:hypothetical protein J1605_011595 [Eschrichtius robustus]|uniref:Uncharacterized protein n=1 Tax=Eschrichtius robustus TaxID=9764 RepID=A0AB34GL68_ESCRO|nr:hypothetical protein J1605_011595 [Eschrichtius robustus]
MYQSQGYNLVNTVHTTLDLKIEDAMLGAVAVILNYEGYFSNGDRIHQSNRIEIMWLPHIGKPCITHLQTLVLIKVLTTA